MTTRLKSMMGAALALALGASPAPAQTLDWRAVPLPGIEGVALPPETFLGKVVLVVNTASECGFTPQYAGLQQLWREYRDRGVVVLGVPSNEFGGQEPGGNAEVAAFCTATFAVDFPMLEKQVVRGEHAHPLYRWAAARTGPLGLPRWNFHKLLIGRDGALVDWFSSLTDPDAARLRAALDRAVAAPFE